ncbi:nitroreductase [Amycolatopsis bartoniae]|uniref:Oxidoreductase n=1 Tax=Amycolatopsis bartoniae TaxID=941986 RepID=A0A8H9J083_9PSEU|nr:nitroreductase family protein [Amycolatopsis bartoniae]MBB2936598.1 nitroreductase [Amycolatopsis bartoniae]TVT09815.1 nitroreductase family protein [Amycolatopsis bartoniae]GHF67791.1 oxidoreductase [Amycolatopsis bartoniae]
MNDSSPTNLTLGLTADQVLTTTRAVRRRLDLTRPVPRELIQEAVAIATQAPTGRNQQQWDFVFVDDPATKVEMANLWRAGLAHGSPDEHHGLPLPTRGSFASAEWGRIRGSLGHLIEHLHEVPVLMIPVVRVATRAELGTVHGQAHNWGSVLPATWSFMLAARERGLGTCWTIGHLAYEREMADLLGLPFDTTVQVALIPVAYTIGIDFKPAPRVDAKNFVHWNGW